MRIKGNRTVSVLAESTMKLESWPPIHSPTGRASDREHRQFSDHHGGHLAIGESYDPEGGEIAAALG